MIDKKEDEAIKEAVELLVINKVDLSKALDKIKMDC